VRRQIHISSIQQTRCSGAFAVANTVCVRLQMRVFDVVANSSTASDQLCTS
jgi:hypothetical protein